MSTELTDFLDDARFGPWRPEPDTDGDGLRRRHDTIWLTNDDGDSLQVDEDHAALLINSALDGARGFEDLLTIGESLLTHYPPETIVCSHRDKADIGARTVAAIADLIASCRAALTASPEPCLDCAMNPGLCDTHVAATPALSTEETL